MLIVSVSESSFAKSATELSLESPPWLHGVCDGIPLTIPIFLVTYDLCAEYLVERDRYWKQKTLVTEDRPVCKEVIGKYHRDEQRGTFSRKAHGNQMRFENKSIDADRKQIIVCIDSLAN